MKTEDILLMLTAALGIFVFYRRAQVQQSGMIRVNASSPGGLPASPFSSPGVTLRGGVPARAPTVQSPFPSLNYLDLPPGSVWNEETDGFAPPYYSERDLANLYL